MRSSVYFHVWGGLSEACRPRRTAEQGFQTFLAAEIMLVTAAQSRSCTQRRIARHRQMTGAAMDQVLGSS